MHAVEDASFYDAIFVLDRVDRQCVTAAADARSDLTCESSQLLPSVGVPIPERSFTYLGAGPHPNAGILGIDGLEVLQFQVARVDVPKAFRVCSVDWERKGS